MMVAAWVRRMNLAKLREREEVIPFIYKNCICHVLTLDGQRNDTSGKDGKTSVGAALALIPFPSQQQTGNV